MHLLSCHLPFVGGLLVCGLLLYGRARRQLDVVAAAELGAVVVALGSGLAWATGPAALTDLEAWIDPAGREFAERHAGLGDLATLLWSAAGILALWGMFLRGAGRPSPRWRERALCGLMLASVALAAWAGHEGGRIRHTELRGAGVVDAVGGAGTMR
jgi:hypothetical protein